MKIYKNVFENIISLENLFSAWDKFKSNKQKKQDVQQFEWRLEQNIFQLYRNLKCQRYKHGAYTSFYIHDPKQRHIHKATVRDRVLHRAVFKTLNPIFEPTFIPNSLSCRVGKGTHKGIDILEKALRQISKNNFKPCFVLKCDIKKFFETIDHRILLNIISQRIKDEKAIWFWKKLLKVLVLNIQPFLSQRECPLAI